MRRRGAIILRCSEARDDRLPHAAAGVPALSSREDWLGRWREGRIGWHEARGNAALRRHWRRLPAGSRVLVPLCGKSRDLKWLADRGHAVVGIELSELAVATFFEEQALAFDRSAAGRLTRYRARAADITLYAGDYFEFGDTPCDALFDRGALVALQAAERPRYAEHTDSLLAPAAERLVITLEYDQSRVDGPPFAVRADELLGYWPDLELIERRNDIDDAPPKFREAGLEVFDEAVWRSPRRKRPDA